LYLLCYNVEFTGREGTNNAAMCNKQLCKTSLVIKANSFFKHDSRLLCIKFLHDKLLLEVEIGQK